MKARTAAGIGMILCSFGFFGAGGYVLNEALDAKYRATRQKQATHEQCISFLKTIPNSQVTETGNKVVVVMKDASDPRRVITDASISALMCPGKKVANACLGDQCSDA